MRSSFPLHPVYFLIDGMLGLVLAAGLYDYDREEGTRVVVGLSLFSWLALRTGKMPRALPLVS